MCRELDKTPLDIGLFAKFYVRMRRPIRRSPFIRQSKILITSNCKPPGVIPIKKLNRMNILFIILTGETNFSIDLLMLCKSWNVDDSGIWKKITRFSVNAVDDV